MCFSPEIRTFREAVNTLVGFYQSMMARVTIKEQKAISFDFPDGVRIQGHDYLLEVGLFTRQTVYVSGRMAATSKGIRGVLFAGPAEGWQELSAVRRIIIGKMTVSR